MRELQQSVNKFLWREDGLAGVEYAVMLAIIILVCLAQAWFVMLAR